MVSTLSSPLSTEAVPADSVPLWSSDRFRDMYEGLLTHARCYAANQGHRSPRFWSSSPKTLPEALVRLLEHIAASFETERLVRIPSSDIFGLLANCGFDNHKQAEKALRSHCCDLYHNVLATWPKDAPFAKWLSATKLRKHKLDTELEQRVLPKLQPPSPFELSKIRPPSATPDPSPTAPDPSQTARPLRIDSDAVTGKPSKRILFTDWRFRDGSSNKMHLIDVQVRGSDWMTEQDAHQKFQSQLLNFWCRQGGRENAIREAGGDITENTEFLINRIVKERGNKCLVQWVGYGSADNTWEPKRKIGIEFISECRRKRRRRSL